MIFLVTNMNENIGLVYRILRKQKNIRLSDLTDNLNISTSKLSDFEQGKRKLTVKEIKQLYKFIDLEYIVDDTINAKVEDGIKELFHHISFCDGKEEQVIEQLDSYINEIKCSLSYFTYILCKFVYDVYHPQEYHNHIDTISVLERNIDLLSPLSKQILYDTIGVYYKNHDEYEKALAYFESGKQHNVSDTGLAMIYYHESMILIFQGKLSNALEYVEKSLHLFMKELNFIRNIMVTLSMAIIQSRLRYYEKASKTYHKILEAMKTIDMGNEVQVYNNLIWNDVLCEKYEEVISNSEIALKLDPTHTSIHTYVTYTFWRLGQTQKAKESLKQAQKYIKNGKKYDCVFIKVLSSILFNRPYEMQEQRLLEALDISIKCNDYQLELFTLELLSDISHSYGNVEKETTYLRQAIDVLKRVQ